MKSANSSAATIAAALIVLLIADRLAAQDPSQNAALQYWQAFSRLPPIGSRAARLVDTEYSTARFAAPVSPELAKLFLDYDLNEALIRLHKGSKLRDCSWGTQLGQEWPLTASYAERAHRLMRVSVLRARWRFEHDQWDDGVDDVIATMMMARHIGRDKHTVGLHHGVQIESSSVRAAGMYVPRMPSAVRDRLAAKLAALPPVTSMTELFHHYADTVDWIVEELKGAEKTKEVVPLPVEMREAAPGNVLSGFAIGIKGWSLHFAL